MNELKTVAQDCYWSQYKSQYEYRNPHWGLRSISQFYSMIAIPSFKREEFESFAAEVKPTESGKMI